MKLFKSPKGKILRRFGVNIYDSPKYDKILERRPLPPGQHGAQSKRLKQSEYGKQLVEKQKLKFAYGMTEKQFRNLFIKASNSKGAPGVNLMQSLERRLDSVVFRSGFASTRAHARQMVNHGHFLLNDKKVNIPSILVNINDKITVRSKKCSQEMIKNNIEQSENRARMPWLSIDETKKQIVFNKIPERAEIPILIQEQLIVELYSR